MQCSVSCAAPGLLALQLRKMMCKQGAQLLGLGHLSRRLSDRHAPPWLGRQQSFVAQQLHGFAHGVRLTPNSCAKAPSLMSEPGGKRWLRMRSRSLSAMAMHSEWACMGLAVMALGSLLTLVDGDERQILRPV
jgi:hypothetical protein